MLAIRPAQPNLRHGVTLPVDEGTIARYETRLTKAAPHLAHERYAMARNLLARNLIRLDRVDLWYARTPRAWFIKSTGSGKAAVQAVEGRYASLMTEAWRGLRECGLTPAGAKELGMLPDLPNEAVDVVGRARALARAQEAEFAAYRERTKNGDGHGDESEATESQGDGPAV